MKGTIDAKLVLRNDLETHRLKYKLFIAKYPIRKNEKKNIIVKTV